MAVTLGVSCHYHNAAAALVVDGQLVAAIAEERLSRVKNDPSVPVRAIAAVRRLAGDPEIDQVVFYESPYGKLERVLVHLLRQMPRSLPVLPGALADQVGTKLWVLDALASATGVPRSKVWATTHHKAHAASAFYGSGWPQAAVLTVDGVGEDACTALWRGDANGLTLLESTPFPNSLGLLYAGITAWLGFRVNEGEFKTMGLAAFGTPHFADELAKVAVVDPGGVRLNPAMFGHFVDPSRGYGPALEAVLGPARPLGKPWDVQDPQDQRYADVAATLQQLTETAMQGLAARVRTLTGLQPLCLAGGVALNAVANHTLPAPVFVHPAAGDAGGAVGAAWIGAVDAGDVPGHAGLTALGVVARPDRALAMADALGLRARRVDPVAVAAQALEAGQLVAWCQGRCEWGPRALGHRSLLADPTSATMRDTINARVKHREPFRPFAPAVLAERFANHFVGTPDAMTPFMTTVRRVRTPEVLGATTHVDGTARVQSVHEGPLRPLLERVALPAVLNTSLNGRGEPICATDVDALSFLLRHPVDVLLIDDVQVTR